MVNGGPVRFGVFEFDPATRELRRDGMPVRLQAQPAQILAVLLARPGEVVGRDELRQAVWGTETFVDFDRGLNFCVAQIRSALGDSAESPRYIRTLPKRGYQFIAPVAGLDVPPPPAAVPPRRRPFGIALVSAALLAALILTGWYGWSARAPVRIAVARFDNETGNPALDRFTDALTDSVVADFTTSHDRRYGVIGNAAILRVPRARRDLLAIASSLHVRYVVIGQVQGDPSHPRVLAHLIRVPEQTHLWVTRRENVSLDDAARAQTEMAALIVSEFVRRLASPAARPN